MPSPHAAVTKPEYSLEIQAGLAVVSLRYVTEQTQYFALLIDGNRNVPLGGEIKPPDLGVLEHPDRRDRCRADCLLIRKRSHRCESLFAGVQDQNERPTVMFGSQFGFHEPSRGKT